MNYNEILRGAAKIAIEERESSLVSANCLKVDIDVVTHLEKELNPKYMNDIFTWGQIKKALEKHY